MTKRRTLCVLWLLVWPACAPLALAQGSGAGSAKPRPWSRVSFFANSARTSIAGEGSRTFTELSTALSYQLPDVDSAGADYGVDVRVATYPGDGRPERLSLYEGFVGARLMNGRTRVRVGHLTLGDLGSLGALAGGLFEYRRLPTAPEGNRLRVGVFGGAEPNVLDAGYAPHVRKFGAYAGYDAGNSRRHSLGYAMVRNGRLTERSVLTVTNLLPVGPKVFVYQMAEYNLARPAETARRGVAYFLSNVRVTPNRRVDVQINYNRGRAIDARGLGDDILSERPVSPTAIEGLLYESLGGRATVEVWPRIRVYAGHSRDKNNRDTSATGRTLVGGYASNVGGWGVDVSASDSFMHRPDNNYHSRYLSVGRQFGRSLYASADYSTSLSVVRFSRSDGITIETRPRTTRVSGMTSWYVSRSMSVMGTVERTNEDDRHEWRLLAGLTYRMR